ncbi:MAG: hypothetical protein DME49_01825 [Verrucomicrobia bacterium]|nr:MAG: hypothetical protein DME49_01825 [Verrucomicrobiota bacterium]PYK93153.1 MAG: hypothetical protein DME36_10470 [Verrucomicrobiota bacterium]PYL57516.1 MAG: hypothetical protein DMF30_06005 [Verrucomicrobiota bacterium]
MASRAADDFRLTVLNPGGRDPEQHFRDGAGPVEQRHPPVNFHGYAACARGSFHQDTQRAIMEETPVLLLLRGDFRSSERALGELKKHGQTVAVSLKETGLHQIAQQLCIPAKLARFMKIVAQADGCIATTPEAAEIYRGARGKRDPATVAFIPPPYPLEDRQWNFSVPPDQQSGIFVGTREWDVPSRNHFAALLVARQLCEASGEPASVVNLDGRRPGRLFSELKFPDGKLRLIEKRKPYADYLREVAKHKIVLQLDRSRVPGQVAGDALLCRMVCAGGDGAIERIAFPRTCGEGRTIDEITSIAQELLNNVDSRGAVVAESQGRALERISFRAVREQLAEFFARIAL